MGRKWNNIKEKKAQKIKIQVEFMPFGKEIYVAQNLVNLIQNLTKHYV